MTILCVKLWWCCW